MKIFDIAFIKMKLILKDKGSLAWMFLAPLLFITVIVYGFEGTDNKVNVSIVDNAKTDLSKEMIEVLKDNDEYPLEVVTFQEGKKNLVNGTSIMIIAIPKDFDKMIKEEQIKDFFTLYKIRDNQRVRAISNMIESKFLTLRIKYNICDVSKEVLTDTIPALPENTAKEISKKIETEYSKEIKSKFINVIDVEEMEKNNDVNELTYSTIGIMIIFILFFVVNGAGTLLQERKDGVISRLKSTDTADGVIVIGQALGLFIVGWIQVIVLILIGKYVYKISWGESVLGLILIFSAFLLASAMLGILIGNLSKNRKMLTSLTAIIVMPTSLLGGCMWSKDMMSDLLIKVSYITPQSWFMDGIVDLVVRNSSMQAVIRPSVMLCVFALIFYLLNCMVKKRLNH